MGPAAPHRYLVAYLGSREPDRKALLRFPPGVTLEDAGHDWGSLHYGVDGHPLPQETVERLRGLGVEIAIRITEDPVESWIAANANVPSRHAVDFDEEYLDTNARLGGGRCISVEDYAMHTWMDGRPLHNGLRNRLLHSGDVRAYGDVAFHARRLPRVLSLRLWDFRWLPGFAPSVAPCLLHGDECRNYPFRDYGLYSPGLEISTGVDPRCWCTRVAAPRRLLDGLVGKAGGNRRARAARDITRLVLDVLPDNAWRDDLTPWDFALAIAFSMSETCEECVMLAGALQECRSAREVVRRARDTSWAVSRALEDLRDG